jgi:hypothetical protein
VITKPLMICEWFIWDSEAAEVCLVRARESVEKRHSNVPPEAPFFQVVWQRMQSAVTASGS